MTKNEIIQIREEMVRVLEMLHKKHTKTLDNITGTKETHKKDVSENRKHLS